MTDEAIDSTSLLDLLQRVHAEIDALDEGIPMSAETWDELCEVVKSNKEVSRRP